MGGVFFSRVVFWSVVSIACFPAQSSASLCKKIGRIFGSSPNKPATSIDPRVLAARKDKFLGHPTRNLNDQSVLILAALMHSGHGYEGHRGSGVRLELRGLPGALILFDSGIHATVFLQNGPAAAEARHKFENYAKERNLNYRYNDIQGREITPPQDFEYSRQFFITLDTAKDVDQVIEFISSQQAPLNI